MKRALLPSLVLVTSLTGIGTQWYASEENYEQVPYIPIKTMNVCECNNLRQTSRYLDIYLLVAGLRGEALPECELRLHGGGV